MATGSQEWTTRNNEFLKYVSQGAGLGRIKHCVLDADAFPAITVAEGNVIEKKIARKGQVIVRNASSSLWGPLKSSVVAEEGATGDTVLEVEDASVFSVGDSLDIEDVTGERTVTAINYETNVLTLNATLGATVAVGNTVTTDEFSGAGIDDWAVCADEIDLSYGDEPVGGYYLHCVFYKDALYGYAGNEALVEAGLSTCEFEDRIDPTA